MTHLKEFLTSEDGAITVDWVVLTAALVGLGFATVVVISGGTEDLTRDTTAVMASVEPGTLYDWTATGAALVNTGWGDLGIFSPTQSASGAENYVSNVLSSNGGDYQATYDQLYQQALDMTYAHGESVDDFGAFEAMAAADGASIDTGDNMTYAEMHATYAANGSL